MAGEWDVVSTTATAAKEDPWAVVNTPSKGWDVVSTTEPGTYVKQPGLIGTSKAAQIPGGEGYTPKAPEQGNALLGAPEAALNVAYNSVVAAPVSAFIAAGSQVLSGKGTKEANETFDKVYEAEVTKGKDHATATEIAQKSKINDKVRVLIESRGIGGQIVCNPSVGYELIHGDYYSITEITPEERDVLFGVARQFNEVMQEIVVPKNSNMGSPS